MSADDDTRLADLRLAVYGAGASPTTEQMLELAELERRRTTWTRDRGLIAVAGERAEDGRRADGAVIVTAPPTLHSAGDHGAADPVAAPAPLARRLQLLVGAAVIAAVAFVSGSLVGTLGSQAGTDVAPVAAPAAVTGELLGYVPDADEWLPAVMAAAEWDDASPEYLGSIDGVSVLVGTVNDGAQVCRVTSARGEVDTVCGGSGLIGTQISSPFLDGRLFVFRDLEHGAYFQYAPRSYATTEATGWLVDARRIAAADVGTDEAFVRLAGAFNGVSVWTAPAERGLCVVFVSDEGESSGCSGDLPNGDRSTFTDPIPSHPERLTFDIVRTGASVVINASSRPR